MPCRSGAATDAKELEPTLTRRHAMTRLSINIDHVATVRQARRGSEPDPVWAAVEAELGGADGITFHLREDRRHVQDHDVERLQGVCRTPLNFELAPVEEIVAFACRIKPALAMLVPERRMEVTTEGGLDLVANSQRIKKVIGRFRKAGVRTSAFIDADLEQIEAAKHLGFSVCEIHTGPYAHLWDEHHYASAPAVVAELTRIRKAGERIAALGMQFNAGHGLNVRNVPALVAACPHIAELHIGHSVVSRAVFIGMREAVREMKALL